MIRAVIFDLDNPLTDFMRMKEAGVEAAVDGMLDAGLRMPRDEMRRKLFQVYEREGIEDQQVFDKFLVQELGQIDYRVHAAAIVAYRRARGASLVPYPHVNYTLVEMLKRGLKIAVVSDAPRLQAWLRLVGLGLHHLISDVVAFEDTGKRKPHAAPFRRALELLDVAPAEAIMVGDWVERDVVGANSLGMVTVFARYGDTKETTHSGADYEIDDLLELLGIVEELNGAPQPGGGMPPREADRS
jgi:putative hydrolase of the HAD superfamily